MKKVLIVDLIAIVIIGLVVAVSGCNVLNGSNSIDQAINVIDRGIDDINTGSADWQTVLERVANDLPEDISATIRNDAQNLATRSIAAAGAEARCETDFLERRAVQSLENLKAELLGTTPSLLPPVFCQVAPPGIDMKSSPSSWSMVTLHGYDLDHRDSTGRLFKVLALDNNGVIIPFPENRIGRTTHYQVTLNMGDLEKWLYDKNIVKLIVEWDGSTFGNSEIVVIPWTPDIKTEYKNIARTTFMPLGWTNGDRDFDTNDDEPMKVTVWGDVDITEQFISCRVYMYAKEEKYDYTTVSGFSGWHRAYTAPKGWKIIDVRPRENSRYTCKITDQDDHQYSRPAGEVVKYFKVWGDRKGDDAGVYTKVEVYWNKLEIILEETVPEWY